MSDLASTPIRSDEEQVDLALGRAVVWRFLSLGFAPPSTALGRFLAPGPDADALTAALSLLELPGFDDEGPLQLDDTFSTIFGHTLRGEVCPYETEYGRPQVFQQAQELADLQGWYAAFGLERHPHTPERADHIGVACEFAGFLAQKEAYTIDRGDDEQLELVRQAYRRFLRDHLARFGIAVAVRLEASDPTGFYGCLGSLCRALLTTESRRVGVKPGPAALPLRPEMPDDVPAACGIDSECDSCAPPEQTGSPANLLDIRRD